jgi:probable F420-dependent oxidoreductase
MKFGLHSVNLHTCGYPETAARLARAAEAAGFESLWVADHVVLPDPPLPQRPMAPHMRLLDPVVMLTFYAAHTTRMRLATGVIVLPQRNPLVLAKQAASLDVLSGGRLALGVGAGYLEPEMTAVGVPMAGRGKRVDEYLDAMTQLWTAQAPRFHGEFVSFADVDAHPRPVQPGGPQIVIGGHSPGAFRRAVSRGHAWLGIGTPDDLVAHLSSLAKAATEVDRPARLGKLRVYFLPMPFSSDPDDIKRYADLGVEQLVLYPEGVHNAEDAVAFLEKYAALA